LSPAYLKEISIAMLVTDKQLVRAMQSPSFYPHNPPSVEMIQTHISRVFIAGDKVYKVKKSVNFGFLDFSTLDKRKFYCEEELRLNSRLAPSVYESVVPITDDGLGNPVLNGKGEVIEYTLVMRRLPEERMLYRLLAQGKVETEVMDAIARCLYEFHGRADTGGEIDRLGSLETIKLNHDENFSQTEPYIGRALSASAHRFMKACAHSFMDKNEELFQRRVKEHRIRDCHGDLHLQHICLDGDEIVIFDCIEFNRRFRYLDVAAEIAFLSMDLEGNGYREHEKAFVNAYLNYSGDVEIVKLLNFYRAFFAFVRGKVTAFRLDDPATDEAEKNAITEEAARYFERSAGYASRPEKPTLILMTGLMGSGKSSLAEQLAVYLNATVIQSDVLRKQLLGIEPSSRRYEPYGKGIYGEEMTRKTYDEAMERARAIMDDGGCVIVDASFRRKTERERFRFLAERQYAGFFAVECACPDEEIKKRLNHRVAKSGSVSDGRWEIYEAQKKDFDPIDDIDPREHIRADTSLPLSECVYDVLEKLKGVS